MKNSFDANGATRAANQQPSAQPPSRSFAPFWILLAMGLVLGSVVVLLYIARQSQNARHAQKQTGDVPVSKTLATRFEFEMKPPKMTARQRSIWQIKIVDAKEIDQRASTPDNPKNKYIRSFMWDGDDLINLMLVSKDNSYFARLRPEYKDYGHFLLNVAVPRAGQYTLIADYLPHNKDKREIVLHDLDVAGFDNASPVTGSLQSSVDANGLWDAQSISDEYSIQLKDRNIRTGQDEILTFELRDKNEKPITDLEPYRGVAARCAIISDDFKTYVHAALEDKQPNNGRGPQISFKANFPRAGKYTLWAQFQHREKIVTQPIEIQVK